VLRVARVEEHERVVWPVCAAHQLLKLAVPNHRQAIRVVRQALKLRDLLGDGGFEVLQRGRRRGAPSLQRRVGCTVRGHRVGYTDHVGEYAQRLRAR
jgi:hypothetical protein